MGTGIIKKFEFGRIDANNELQAVGEDFFVDSFMPYEQYQIDKFLSGSKYYICGDKGTGKTALLKYLECTFSKEKENKVVSIRFKSDIDEDDRKGMHAKVRSIDETTIEQRPDDLQSYKLAWYLFILKTIFEAEKTGEYLFFEESTEKDIIRKLLELIYEGQVGRVIPHIKKGRFLLSASSTGLSAEIEGEIEFDKQTKQINFIKTIKKILALFDALRPGRNNVYLLFDELELSIRNKKELKRDVELIRDLILVIDEINKLANQKGLCIRLIGSVRNDVLTHVSAAGYEINKCIEDFGVSISWYRRGGDEKTQPLLRMIEKKINASEKRLGIAVSENVWETYFQQEINNEAVTKYILGLTWYRPRDIIRLLNLAQNMAEDKSNIINQEMFDRAMLEYAKKSWECASSALEI